MLKKFIYSFLILLFSINISLGQQVIDLLVAYTSHVQNYTGSSAETISIIQTAVSNANASFAASGIDIQYNLVKITLLSYSEGSKTPEQIWSDFSANSTIANLRNEYNADLCFLVFNNSNATGYGKIPPNDDPSSSTANIGFAVGNISKVKKIYTLAHELGHCFGARHDYGQDNAGAYNHGYIAPDGTWGSIMSYVSDPENRRLNIWSNPNKSHNGIATGNSVSNNAQWLNEQKQDVANYYVPILSGTLTKNQTLSGRSFVLTGNLNVPTGKTLKLLSNAVIDFNGYKITSTGGVIIFESGANMNAVLVKNSSGNIIEANNSSLQATINNAANNSTIELYGNNTYTIAGNIAIPTSKTFKLSSSNSLNLSAYSINSTGGTITIEGGATITGLKAYLKTGSTLKGLFPTIQSAINSAASNQTVELLSATYSGSLSFSSKSNLTLNGLGSGSTILNGNISVTNSEYIYIASMRVNGTISTSSSHVTQISSSVLSASTILNDYGSTNTSLGFSTATYGGASFAFNSYGGTGDIFYNTISNYDVAVYLTSSASYNVGDQNLFCNNLLDIYAPSPSYAYAISNDYSAALPQTIYGNVFTTGTNGVCGMMKSAIAAKENESNSITSQLLKNADKKYLTLLRKINEDTKKEKFDKNKYASDFSSLIGEYKNIINVEKDKNIVKAALSKLNHLYKTSEDKKTFSDYLKQLSNNKTYEEFLPYINRYFIWNYVDKKDYEAAVAFADELINTAKDDADLSSEMLYEKGLIYKYYLGDENKAEESFTELITKYPKNLLAQYAAVETGIELKNSEKINTSYSEQAEGYSIDNYPNPFNPTTIINYNLPQSGHVVIKVYDVLGREIANLVNEVKEKGNHNVEFNANNLASGLYIYSIRVNGFSASKKMLLTK